MHRTVLLPALAALAFLALPAHAQRVVRAGETVTGALEASDPTLDDGTHYDVYAYQGREGETLVITLESSDFDAYLAFGPFEDGEVSADETDDDGGGGTDARLRVTLDDDGRYGIRVNSLSEGETGSYTLRVASAPTPTARHGDIRPGETVTGTFDEDDATADDDSYYELWTYRGPPGRTITITMRSDDVDAFLAWGRIVDGEFEEIDSDDDGAGGTDARLVVTPERGEFVIRANTLSSGETGRYTLRVEEGEVSSDDEEDVVMVEEVDTVAVEVEVEELDFGAVPTRPIRPGQTVRGELEEDDPALEDGSHIDHYAYTGRAGERLTITLRSDDFDAILGLWQARDGDYREIDTDDDGAGGTDARLEVTLPASGVYVIRVNTLAGGETGRYTLTVERG